MLYLVLDGLGSKEEHLIRTRFTSQHSNSHIPCLNLIARRCKSNRNPTDYGILCSGSARGSGWLLDGWRGRCGGYRGLGLHWQPVIPFPEGRSAIPLFLRIFLVLYDRWIYFIMHHALLYVCTFVLVNILILSTPHGCINQKGLFRPGPGRRKKKPPISHDHILHQIQGKLWQTKIRRPRLRQPHRLPPQPQLQTDQENPGYAYQRVVSGL